MTVYERIKEISKSRGMSLQSVAKAAGLSQNMIYQYKTVNPKTETLRTLADVLGVSVDYLLGKTDEKKPVYPEDDLDPDKVVLIHKIADTDLDEKQVAELDSFFEYLKQRYIDDVREIEHGKNRSNN